MDHAIVAQPAKAKRNVNINIIHEVPVYFTRSAVDMPCFLSGDLRPHLKNRVFIYTFSESYIDSCLKR